MTSGRWRRAHRGEPIARRSPVVLAGIVAGIALLLAAVGTYGALQLHHRSTPARIGVRMALVRRRTTFDAIPAGPATAAVGIPGDGAWAVGKGMRRPLAVPKLHSLLFGTALVMTAVSLSPAHPRASCVASRPCDCARAE